MRLCLASLIWLGLLLTGSPVVAHELDPFAQGVLQIGEEVQLLLVVDYPQVDAERLLVRFDLNGDQMLGELEQAALVQEVGAVLGQALTLSRDENTVSPVDVEWKVVVTSDSLSVRLLVIYSGGPGRYLLSLAEGGPLELMLEVADGHLFLNPLSLEVSQEIRRGPEVLSAGEAISLMIGASKLP